jgi:hypothetical protein
LSVNLSGDDFHAGREAKLVEKLPACLRARLVGLLVRENPLGELIFYPKRVSQVRGSERLGTTDAIVVVSSTIP